MVADEHILRLDAAVADLQVVRNNVRVNPIT